MVNLALVGVGYWGPNLLRNFANLPNVRICAICDMNEQRAVAMRERLCPGARILSSTDELARDDQIQAVVIATPVRTHYEMASKFLAAGKHVFVEKPLAQTVGECEKLVELAERGRRVLMVGHVFLFNAAVRRVKQYLTDGTLGQLYYVCSQRVNLGRVQYDLNALWSLAPHDFSIMRYWLGTDPVRVAARGFSYLNTGIEDVVFVTLEYPGGIGVHLHLGWLDPRKVRQMTLIGSKRMLVYDDISADCKIQIYDKGVAAKPQPLEAPETFAQFQYQARIGDVTIPSFPFEEPLETECRHFVDCIEKNERPLADGREGLQVVRLLLAAVGSLERDGAWVQV